MSDATEADRERAALALNYGPDERVSPMDQEYVDQIAAALAEEREKARAPFLALAEELEQSELPLTWLVLRRRPRPEAWVLAIRAAERIRRIVGVDQ